MYLMVVIIVAALIRGKSNPVPLFVMVPVIAALICGFSPAEIFGFVKAGVSKTWSTAVLFIFSIVYFSMMGDMGLFALNLSIFLPVEVSSPAPLALMISTSISPPLSFCVPTVVLI